MKFINKFFANDIGIDIGTSNIVIYVKNNGIVLNEPSLIAVDKKNGRIIKYGKEAQQMSGRTLDGNIEIVRPIKNGVIEKYDFSYKMLHCFLQRACGRKFFQFRPRVLVSVPSCISEVEKNTIRMAVDQAGSRDTILVSKPIAALLGAGVDINAKEGNMIVYIGAGTVEATVVSYGGIICSEFEKIGGDDFTNDIREYIRVKYHVRLNERIAEDIKKKVASIKEEPISKIEVKGSTILEGLPMLVTFASNETLNAVNKNVAIVLDVITKALSRIPPELIGDIYKNKIILTGGGSMLRGMKELIETIVGIEVIPVKEPMLSVAYGLGKKLDEIEQNKGNVVERLLGVKSED